MKLVVRLCVLVAGAKVGLAAFLAAYGACNLIEHGRYLSCIDDTLGTPMACQQRMKPFRIVFAATATLGCIQCVALAIFLFAIAFLRIVYLIPIIINATVPTVISFLFALIPAGSGGEFTLMYATMTLLLLELAFLPLAWNTYKYLAVLVPVNVEVESRFFLGKKSEDTHSAAD